MTLTLERARREGRLQEFIRQQELWERDNGFNGANAKQFDRELKQVIKAPPQEDQTSRFRDGDD